MAKTQPLDAALPGDVIQIVEAGPFCMALMIAEECRRTFTRASMPTVRPDGKIGLIEYRVQPGTYEVVGVAKAVESTTAKARETMRRTLAGEG